MLVLRKYRGGGLTNEFTSYTIDYTTGPEPIYYVNWDIIMIRHDLTEVDRILFLHYFNKYKIGNDIIRCITENQINEVLSGFKNRTREELLKHIYNRYSPRRVLNILNTIGDKL